MILKILISKIEEQWNNAFIILRGNDFQPHSESLIKDEEVLGSWVKGVQCQREVELLKENPYMTDVRQDYSSPRST